MFFRIIFFKILSLKKKHSFEIGLGDVYKIGIRRHLQWSEKSQWTGTGVLDGVPETLIRIQKGTENK